MLKLQVEGRINQVFPFLKELKSRSDIVVNQNEIETRKQEKEDQIFVAFYIDYQPSHRCKVVKLIDQKGVELQIPLLDVICMNTEEGTTIIAGKSYDIFT